MATERIPFLSLPDVELALELAEEGASAETVYFVGGDEALEKAGLVSVYYSPGIFSRLAMRLSHSKRNARNIH
jgi:hypothetical protein